MTENPHFTSVPSWETAEALLSFVPRILRETAGYGLQSLAVHVRDHNERELPVGTRSLEAHYGGFVFTQARQGDQARRSALSIRYGQESRSIVIAGREGRAYELGPEVPEDDVDGRSPAVVVWHDDGMFYLLASTELSADELLLIAGSVHATNR